MNIYAEKLMNIEIYEGRKAPEEIVLNNGVTLEMAYSPAAYNLEKSMDYDLSVYPPVKFELVKDTKNKWHIRGAIIGILEDDIDFWSPYVSAWLLQEMGYEENLIDVKMRVLLDDEEEGFVIPAFDKDYGTVLNFIKEVN